MESPGELVVHAAFGHRTQCLVRHLLCRRFTAADAGAEQEFDQHRLRKFRCAAEAAVDRVMVPLQPAVRLIEEPRREGAAGERDDRPFQEVADLRRRGLHFGGPPCERLRHGAQHPPERWHAEPIARWKVCAGEERCAVG